MLKITDKEKMLIVLGAGGTGSWLASFLSKLDIEEKYIIDGDIVEPKNVLRQNFINDDVNKMKAECIGMRYNFGFISEFITNTEILDEIIESTNKVPVIVGCLDNNATRKIAHDVFKKYDDIIWVDSGNAERHGQCYISVKQNRIELYKSPLDIDEVFMNFEGDERRPDQISCAEHSESAPQNVTANITAATMVFDILNIIISGKMLLGNKMFFDTRTMSFKFETVTGENNG